MNLAKIHKLNIVGVSWHVGSNCRVKGQFEKAIKNGRQVFDMGISMGFDMNIVDIGGGFPGTDECEITFEELAREINIAIDTYFLDLPNVKFIGEPGRAFCTSSHTLVCTIIGIKSYFNSQSGLMEYSYTINEGVYGSFNCIIFDHAKPLIVPFNERNEISYKSTVYGCSCDSIDVITKDALLPKLAMGERVYVSNFGAYTRASSSSFNGFSTSLIHYIITS